MTSLSLQTPRLILRSFEDRDLEPFAAYRSDPLVARYQGWEAPYSESQARAFVEAMKSRQPGTQGEWYQVAIELTTTGEMIGDCGFRIASDDDQQAEIGYTLARAYQRQGYGAEAVARLLAYLFEELHLHRVRASCFVENVASARLLERVGMRREAHLVEGAWIKGRWASEYGYAMLAREWLARHQVGVLEQFEP